MGPGRVTSGRVRWIEHLIAQQRNFATRGREISRELRHTSVRARSQERTPSRWMTRVAVGDPLRQEQMPKTLNLLCESRFRLYKLKSAHHG
jgi:hypothetical protein